MRRKNIQKPTLVPSIGRWSSSLQRKNTRTTLVVGVLAGLICVVVSAAGCVIEHLDDHLGAAFVEEGEREGDLKAVGAGELVSPGVQVHLALPVEQDIDRPQALAAQLQLDRLGVIDKLVRQYEEEPSIARGGEEQLDKKLDVKLDMELDVKTSHERARKEWEACARGGVLQADARPVSMVIMRMLLLKALDVVVVFHVVLIAVMLKLEHAVFLHSRKTMVWRGRATGAGRYTPRPSPSTAPSTRPTDVPSSSSKPVSNVSNTKRSVPAASGTGSSISTARNRDMVCHTCGGKGHFKKDCPNRKVMIINEDNEYETGDDADPDAPEDDDYDNDSFDAYPSEAQTIVVSQRVLNVQPSASTQRCNLFQTKALVGPDKACKAIIDGGSCRNLASKELCAKLKLKYLPHPHPYYIQWLSNNGEMKVSHMVRVDFEIGPYKDSIDFDVVPMTKSHAGGLMGHFGREKTLLMLADHFYWPNMRRDVDRYVKRCITCNKSKSKLKPHVYELLLEDALEKAGTLVFSTTCHPQTDGQTEVVNRTLSQLLRSMIKKNLKEWEECLPHVEFAYNSAVHSTTELCPFEVVYGFKPITPLDLLPLPVHERVNMEASKRADFVKKIYVKTKELIEKKGKSNAARKNKKRKEMLFKPGDLVWVHFRKDRFPKLRKSKLLPRGAGPYKVLAKINDNAYSIDLPDDEFGVSNSFNVADLTPYDGEDLGASRSTPFEGGDDENIPTSLLPLSLQDEDEAVKLKSNEVRIGPMTRARAKLLKQQVNLFLNDILIDENFILPKSYYFCMIRYEEEPSIARGEEQADKKRT
ncbi:hypothetical protein QYE76_052933 [Lolium multiflorum]|uniref:Uncharacterized protein n=1 Tax=Lolium multiflorum TaxID=4521 RepID=A0AAD8SVI0_LOLMU|nr:hypothetical protein QYE76_052933 [Lolium multiflorum]